MDMGEAGELTYESLRARRAVLVVHADEAEDAERTENLLTDQRPQEIHRFDERGRRLKPA
jgi:hypothetical protein